LGLGGDFDLEVLEERPGFMVLRASGKAASKLLETEPGGHRWQQKSGKKGQIHTSTVTVSVLPEIENPERSLDIRDVRFETYNSGGPGGQHSNRTANAVRAIHVPTGTTARSEGSRSQHQNKALALAALASKVQENASRAVSDSRAEARRDHVGTGMRGDKRRTVRTQDDQVVDHVLGRSGRTKKYMKGDLDWLID
jgi:peptide chain release factor 1